MKYFVAKCSMYSGRVEYQRCKCSELYCSEEYIRRYPDRVWQFSKQGAEKICEARNRLGWHCVWYPVPVEDILGKEART